MAKQSQNIKPLNYEEPDKSVKGYSPSGNEKKVNDQFRRRKEELLLSRKNVSGINIDQKMRDMDRNYFNREADIPASELDVNQKPIAINNAFGKVQSALGLLIDRNPDIILDERLARFAANRELIRSLAKSSWKNTNSLGQLKLFVFNMAKRGFGVGRTFYRQLKHDARFLKEMRTEYDGKDKKAPKKKYKTAEICKVDDIWFQNLDNHNTWIDEEARPEDMFSIRDWTWREVWHIDKIKKLFPIDEYPNMEFVKEGGNVQERIDANTSNTGDNTGSSQSRQEKKHMTEIFFYENQFDDWFIVEVNGVMVVWEPLPQDHKRLSLVTAPWNLRSAEDIYGIGVVEAMERDEALCDRILNMDMRQLLISINPPGFYSGTEDFENENIKLEAGVMRRTLNPKDITFVQIPKPDNSGLDRIQWLEAKEDKRTGITQELEGQVDKNQNATDTAYELGLNREAGLKRLNLPLKSLQFALNWEFQNRIALIQQVYSDFQVEHIADLDDIHAYLDEVKADPQFYYIENEGKEGEETFYKKSFRQIPAEVEQDDSGNFVESEKKNFFHVLPQYLSWDGSVTVDVDSILVQSEELEKADTLRFANLLVPIFQLPPEIGLKPARQLCIANNKDPKKWLPDAWLQMLEQKGQKEPGAAPAPAGPPPPPGQQPPTAPLPGQPAPGQPMSNQPQTLVPEQQLNGLPGGALPNPVAQN